MAVAFSGRRVIGLMQPLFSGKPRRTHTSTHHHHQSIRPRKNRLINIPSLPFRIRNRQFSLFQLRLLDLRRDSAELNVYEATVTVVKTTSDHANPPSHRIWPGIKSSSRSPQYPFATIPSPPPRVCHYSRPRKWWPVFPNRWMHSATRSDVVFLLYLDGADRSSVFYTAGMAGERHGGPWGATRFD